MDDLSTRKLLSVLCHGAVFLSPFLLSIGIPIVLMIASEDPIVKGNARESINFHLNLYLYGIIFVLLVFAAIGIPLLILLWIASLILPIVAIVHCASEPNKPYRYPLILRIV